LRSATSLAPFAASPVIAVILRAAFGAGGEARFASVFHFDSSRAGQPL
jgi:hypothetical protein